MLWCIFGRMYSCFPSSFSVFTFFTSSSSSSLLVPPPCPFSDTLAAQHTTPQHPALSRHPSNNKLNTHTHFRDKENKPTTTTLTITPPPPPPPPPSPHKPCGAVRVTLLGLPSIRIV
ncbi:hypothetical protein E2C01_095413 [Portunus trituberculatus]|uniref:Uncharacterized protein n=1 Tax=Portunus trituberculatus TaxID=210409 RepID=A0A5B7K046_PORTR|nr:hypothetical protein [Portunus trituberculatus]